MNYDRNTRLSDLTVGELEDLIAGIIRRNADDGMARGIQGLADLFGVSVAQAKRIKASGIIAPAVHQQGRTILVDKALALELYGRRHF